MNNQIKGLENEEIKTQLCRADLKKNNLKKTIYSAYEIYLKLVRELLFTSVEKGLYGIYSDASITKIIPNTYKLSKLLDKTIISLVNSQLPLITIEQLEIGEFCKNIDDSIKVEVSNELAETKNSQRDNTEFESNFIYKENLQFDIKDNIFNSSEYYQSLNNDNFVSLDLDNGEHGDFIFDPNTNEKVLSDKRFINSLLELIEEDTRDYENINQYQIENFSNNDDLNRFDLIDTSLTDLLLNLSYKINLELFKLKLIKKIISLDNFKFLVSKNFMIKHPHPFIINFEININSSFKNFAKISNFTFLNVTTVELEYKNINLSNQRNKINELKRQFQILIKKENYWKKKELNLYKLHRQN